MKKIITLMKDKDFQHQMLLAFGMSLAYAIYAFGVLAVWKWYVGYKAFLLVGGSVKAAAWLKIMAGGCIGVFAVGATANRYRAYRDAAKLKQGL